MIEKINQYFIDKKINAVVFNTIQSDNFITFNIALNDINKLNKFNKTMQNELSYILGTPATVSIKSNITITINNSVYNDYKKKGINVNLGVDTLGNVVNVSFVDNPHWLIGGSTGSGKSVFLNNIIKELLKNYNNIIEFCFIDLKKVEFYKYNGLMQNATKVANDLESAITMLDNVIDLMNNRFEKYQKNGCLSIQEYNDKMNDNEYKKDRYLFVIIDELAELMLLDKKRVQERLQRILQLGRASGIYCLSATQRPSSDVLSGTLKVNYTTRICFKVASIYDSKTIINQVGGEQLYGNGDGLLLVNGSSELRRFQGYAPSSDDIVKDNKKQHTSIISAFIDMPKTFISTIIDDIKDLFRL